MICAGTGEIHDFEWHEANYQALLQSNPDDIQRMTALEALLEEQYAERYMTEYAALCYRNGKEREAHRILKKQAFLFPGGQYEDLANRLWEEGPAAAEAVLETLNNEQATLSNVSQKETPGSSASTCAESVEQPDSTRLGEPLSMPSYPEPIRQCFKDVVGMENAKQVLTELYASMQYQTARAGYELKAQTHYHFLIRGNVGTGKTFLSERICDFFFEMGVAQEAAPCVLEGYRLGEFLGTDGGGLEKALNACEGRNVVVDNISSLFDDVNNGKNLPFLFRTVLERYSEKVNFLLLGTKKDIDHLLTLEPSLTGWFLYDVDIPGYSLEELVEMAAIIARRKGYTLSSAARTALLEQLENEYRSPVFQMGKTLETVIGKASPRLAQRIAGTGVASKGTLMRIEPEDLDDMSENLQLDELLAQLDDLTGLSEVKEQVRGLTALARANKEARRLGQTTPGFGTLHMIFSGNAGTGKTTVARIIGKIYRALGVLPQGDKLVECTRADLVAGFVGQTAPKVKAKVDEAMGGVLFIDEAYDICRDDSDSFGQEAINTLVAEIENHRADFMVILAGYTGDINSFLNKNQGLASRFPNRMEFADYSQEEMEQIFQGMLAAEGKSLSEDCAELLKDYIAENRVKRGFGNARGIRNLKEKLMTAQGIRLSARMTAGEPLTPEDFSTITVDDLKHLVAGSGRIKSPDEWLAELNALTGLSSVKEQVRKLTALARTNEEAKRMGMAQADFGTLHMVFSGNAGTGKTTVARIMGGIYRSLGILPEGDKVIECTRAELVAGYMGQTAPKVKAKIDEALGGVLFIDEAYSLCGDNDSYGQEAVDTLVSEIENHRSDLMVILAGYTGDMDKFLSRNQGLASRFPNHMEFSDYSQEEMEQIFLGMLASSGKHLGEGCEELMRAYIEENRTKRGFGNARGIRNLKDKLITAQGLRLGERMAAGETLTAEALSVVTAEDFNSLLVDKKRTKGLKDWLEELNALTGLSRVKEQVQRKVNTMLGQQKMKEAGVIQAFDPGTMHMVFKGNAGTGKTTVARIIAGIYNSLGLLPDGETFVECTRSDLVAEYVGQTAPKVKAVVQRAMGGVLFIDEAYALCKDVSDTFGREAVDALIADMENHRKELMVILAGYTEDMDQFFSYNQGMASRVPTTLIFEDYSVDELFEIFQSNIKRKGFSLSEDAFPFARELIEKRSKGTGFGNARGVRNITEQIIERHTATIGERVASGENMQPEDYLIIGPETVRDAET